MGIGEVEVSRVIVNGIELSQGEGLLLGLFQ